MASPQVTILVCYHKISPIIANEVLQPILVGAACATKDTQQALESAALEQGIALARDDYVAGGGGQPHSLKKEISQLNPYFCELTAMYWAWKNLDCDYYGFFHYRRVLDFTPHTLKARLLRAFTPQTQVILKYHLQPHNIYQFLQESQADIVLPKALKLRPELSAYEDFKLDHIVEDLDKAIAYITKTYPHMQDCIQRALFTKGAKMYHWNLAIYRREVFFEYAQWLFDVLLHIEIDYMHYDSTQGRVFGFLAERLFNVWLDSMRGRLRISERKVRLLYTNQSKFFGKRVSKDYERYYFFFIRVWKRPIK